MARLGETNGEWFKNADSKAASYPERKSRRAIRRLIVVEKKMLKLPSHYVYCTYYMVTLLVGLTFCLFIVYM